MSKTRSIIAGSTSPKGIASKCPGCGHDLINPSMREHPGLSMTLRWVIACPGCGAKVTVENPRYLGGGHDNVHDGRGAKAPRRADARATGRRKADEVPVRVAKDEKAPRGRERGPVLQQQRMPGL